MIITCNNCNSKFAIDSKLIPVNGRLLECSKCNNQWFFKNEFKDDSSINKNIEKKIISDDNFLFDQNTNENNVKRNSEKEKQVLDVNKDDNFLVGQKKSSNKLINNDKKSLGILNFIIIFIISFTALIILIDTFKYPISKVLPNIEVVLYNLYETIKDIMLFFKDLF